MTIGFDVAALGELVIDLIPAESRNGSLLFTAKPGGAPGNVAAGVARLGQRAAMLGRVGPGSLGSLLLEALARAGVDTHGIGRSQADPTALALVSVNSGGESDFMLYRDGCADSRYAPDEVELDIVRACRVLHVGSLSLASPLSAQAQRLAVNTARDAGALISADVNFRPAIWRNLEAMYATGREAIAGADIVKVNAEELAALASATDTATAVRGLWHDNLKLFAVTHGARGAELFTPRCHVRVAGFPVKVADTVGCGDAFMAALLTGLLQNGPATLGEAELHDIGRAACAAGAVMARVVGAMEHMPRQQDIAALIADMG
ncbi:MAG: carbohydrate kinase [Aestuariivirga sp.]